MRGIFVHRQIRAVRDLGVDVRVLCPIGFSVPGTVQRSSLERDEWDGVPVRYFAYWQVPIRLSPAFHGSSLLRALRAALRNEAEHADLYHAHWLFPTAWATARAIGDRLAPVVASARGSDVHTYPLKSQRLRRLTHDALGSATLVTVVSNALKRQAETLGPPGVKIRVIHNGVDDHLFSPVDDRIDLRRRLGLSQADFYWIFVGRLSFEKGTTELLGAFSRLAKSSGNIRVLLVGDGPAAASLKRQFGEAGLRDRVVFAGEHRPEKVAHWLQAANAFVLASHAEGLPNAVLEAMACGLPVVATDVGGTSEAVLDGVTGLLVPPRDVERLATAMSRISTDPALARRLGADGRKRVNQHFGWSASARCWIDVYEEALRMGRARTR